jgi:hypothetical protein
VPATGKIQGVMWGGSFPDGEATIGGGIIADYLCFGIWVNH